MNVRVKFLPRAEDDLLQLPETLQDKILDKATLLETHPRIGVAMTHAYEGYRCLLAASNRYRIIYRVKSPSLVEVCYIRHCRRQIGLRLV